MTTTWQEQQLFDLPPAEQTPSEYKTWKDVPVSTVEEVFGVWRHEHGKIRSILSPERHRAIAKAVLAYGVPTVLDAIRGCALSPWHMGKNPGGKKYNDLSLILRNAEKIEGFAELYQSSRSGGGFLDGDG